VSLCVFRAPLQSVTIIARPANNRFFFFFFFETNGDQTILQTNTVNPAFNSIRIDDARLRNVYLVAPIHLEFDFSKP
jgi:hypothetical protein